MLLFQKFKKSDTTYTSVKLWNCLCTFKQIVRLSFGEGVE